MGYNNQKKDKDLQMLRKHVAALMEHFDSVQIFATKPGLGGGTIQCNDGGGNWFARYGQISLWVDNQTLYEPDGCDNNEDDFRVEV